MLKGGFIMSKIRPTSSIRSKRIHSSFVERTRTIGERASAVDPVTRVNPVANEVAYSSANHLMSSDSFYEKLESLEKEYLNFYHQERNLQKAVEAIEEDMDLDIKYIKNLIDKYNKTALALLHFDLEINTNHSEGIKNILNEYNIALNNMGIYMIEDNRLELDEDLFKKNLLASKDNLKLAFEPIRKMILKLYKRFRNIKGPKKEDLDYKYSDFPNRDYSGMIMDEDA